MENPHCHIGIKLRSPSPPRSSLCSPSDPSPASTPTVGFPRTSRVFLEAVVNHVRLSGLVVRQTCSGDRHSDSHRDERVEQAANRHLVMRRKYEESIENLGALQFEIKEEILKLEVKRAINETVAALNTGIAARQEMQNPKYIAGRYETINGFNETTVRLIQNQDSLRTTPVAASDFNENKLEAPPEEQEQLLQPTTTAPPALVHIPTSPCPAYPVPQRTAKEDVPAALQTEVAR